jgi:hypothetical protein
MFRTPIPNAERQMLENCGSEQLLGIFASCRDSGSRRIACSQLLDAWETLFSGVFLSAEELIDSMQRGEHRLGRDREQMLQEFITADCTHGGAFVLDVIKKGGKIDRAALIMIADLDILSRVESDGKNTIQMLAEACDKAVRPALIMRADKRLLSDVYDSRGLPVLFSIFSLTDLCLQDLEAMAKVFSEEDLGKVMNRNRTGKTALDVFTASLQRLKSHAPGERNTFFVSHAVKTTNMEGNIRTQVTAREYHDGIQTGSPMGKKPAPDEGGAPDVSESYDCLMPDAADAIGTLMKKKQGTR